jgi:inorganic pyrophosphatase
VTAEIGHFFDVYKELERDKGTDVRGWQDRAAAEKIIEESLARFAETTGTEQGAVS